MTKQIIDARRSRINTLNDYADMFNNALPDTQILLTLPEEFELYHNDCHSMDIGRFEDKQRIIDLHNLKTSRNLHLTVLLTVPTPKPTGNSIRQLFMEMLVDETVYWPNFFLQNTEFFLNRGRWPLPNQQKTKLFNSLNRLPHPHRCTLIDQLAKRSLLQHNVFTWLITQEMHGDVTYTFKHWREKQVKLADLAGHDSPPQDVVASVEPPEYNTTAIDLVAESSVLAPFITEKTARPLWHRRPFIIYGGSGTHQLLADLGFELYTELFDYGFDSVDDDELRASKIADQLEKLQHMDYDHIFKLTQPKAQRNLERLIKMMMSPIPSILNEFKSESDDELFSDKDWTREKITETLQQYPEINELMKQNNPL